MADIPASRDFVEEIQVASGRLRSKRSWSKLRRRRITTLRRVCTARLDFSRRPIYAVLRLCSSLFYDYDKALRHNFRLFFCCAHTQKRGCAPSVQNFHDFLHSTQGITATVRYDSTFCACRTNARRNIGGLTSLGIQKGREGAFVRLGYELYCFATHIAIRHIGG